MKALVGAFNQEKALVGAFSVIVQLHRLIVYTALLFTRDVQETAAAKEQLKAIENRHADFLKLEASIREVSCDWSTQGHVTR